MSTQANTPIAPKYPTRETIMDLARRMFIAKGAPGSGAIAACAASCKGTSGRILFCDRPPGHEPSAHHDSWTDEEGFINEEFWDGAV